MLSNNNNKNNTFQRLFAHKSTSSNKEEKTPLILPITNTTNNNNNNNNTTFHIDMQSGADLKNFQEETRHHFRKNLDDMFHMVTPICPQVMNKICFQPFEPCEEIQSPYLKDLPADAKIKQPKYLDVKNRHPRDERVKYMDGPHRYFIDGSCENVLSVSRLYGAFLPGFDSERQALKTCQSKNFREKRHQPSNAYYGCNTMQDVLDKWQHWNNLGTLLHANIECYFNTEPINVNEENKLCFNMFLQYVNNVLFSRFTPFRTEWSIFDEETRIAGQIDLCVVDDWEKKHVTLIDWKRYGSFPCYIRREYVKYGYGVCGDLEANKYNKCALQLNIYKYILEKNYGFYVTKMLIVKLHPKNKGKKVQVFKMPNMQPKILEIMACRKYAMNQKINSSC